MKRLEDSSTDIEIAVDHIGAEAIVRLKGRIDVDSSLDARDHLQAVLSRDPLPHAATVDLSDLSSIEASGIATLIEALKVARHREIRFQLQGFCASVIRVYWVAGAIRQKFGRKRSVLMANIFENVGGRTIEHLDYVGSLNIQWWATVRAMAQAPLVKRTAWTITSPSKVQSESS